jgi:hypothetical protein
MPASVCSTQVDNRTQEASTLLAFLLLVTFLMLMACAWSECIVPRAERRIRMGFGAGRGKGPSVITDGPLGLGRVARGSSHYLRLLVVAKLRHRLHAVKYFAVSG